MELTRVDYLREEALVRARECAPWTNPKSAADVVATAEAFYAFLNPEDENK